MTRALLMLVAVLGVYGCARSTDEGQNPADTLTRRQKDSLVSEMPIPAAFPVSLRQPVPRPRS